MGVQKWKQRIFKEWGARDIPEDKRIIKDAVGYFFHTKIVFDNPDRFCTEAGLDEQLRDFGDYPVGLVYYYLPDINEIQNIAVDKRDVGCDKMVKGSSLITDIVEADDDAAGSECAEGICPVR